MAGGDERLISLPLVTRGKKCYNSILGININRAALLIP